MFWCLYSGRRGGGIAIAWQMRRHLSWFYQLHWPRHLVAGVGLHVLMSTCAYICIAPRGVVALSDCAFAAFSARADHPSYFLADIRVRKYIF